MNRPSSVHADPAIPAPMNAAETPLHEVLTALSNLAQAAHASGHGLNARSCRALAGLLGVCAQRASAMRFVWVQSLPNHQPEDTP